jgi:hypothetical protein
LTTALETLLEDVDEGCRDQVLEAIGTIHASLHALASHDQNVLSQHLAFVLSAGGIRNLDQLPELMSLAKSYTFGEAVSLVLEPLHIQEWHIGRMPGRICLLK